MDEKRRKWVLTYALVVSIIGLPAGLILDMPGVWILSIVGIIMSTLKLKHKL